MANIVGNNDAEVISMVSKSKQNCGNCYFFHSPPLERIREEQSQCRKVPPTVFMIPVMTSRIAGTQEQGAQIMAFWPPMSADKWCGDWKMNEE